MPAQADGTSPRPFGSMSPIHLINQPAKHLQMDGDDVINLLTITFKQANHILSMPLFARWHQLKAVFSPNSGQNWLSVPFSLFVKSPRLQLPTGPNQPSPAAPEPQKKAGRGGRGTERGRKGRRSSTSEEIIISLIPPQPPVGELSCDAWQFAAQLSKIAQTGSFVSPSVRC